MFVRQAPDRRTRHAGGVDRRGRILVTVGAVAALVAPVVLDHDGFPLSTYPMYAQARDASVTFATAQAVDDGDGRWTLSLGVIGDSDDPLIVAGELRAAIGDGRAEHRCREIARRAAVWGGLADEATSIEVVVERRDVIAHVSGDGGLLDRTVHATCEIER